MKSILLKNIRAVDSDTDINCDILIDGGVIKKISGEIKRFGRQRIRLHWTCRYARSF